MPYAIWLIIELDLDFMPTNMFSKFGGDRMKTVPVRERTKRKRDRLTDRLTDRAITIGHTKVWGPNHYG